MKWGMTDLQFTILESIVIQPLKELNCEVYIFGSRVAGKHHPHSDVDILYSSDSNSPLPKGAISKIKERIEESRFPFLVDLVAENELAESYRQNILSSRIKI